MFFLLCVAVVTLCKSQMFDIPYILCLSQQPWKQNTTQTQEEEMLVIIITGRIWSHSQQANSAPSTVTVTVRIRAQKGVLLARTTVKNTTTTPARALPGFFDDVLFFFFSRPLWFGGLRTALPRSARELVQVYNYTRGIGGNFSRFSPGGGIYFLTIYILYYLRYFV